MFSAVKGKGSFLNGQPIHVSNAEKLSDTMIGLGTAKRELADENFARFRRVFGQCQDVRRIGSAALELAYTACGRQGGYFEIYLNPWDYAAGMLLIQEAGGKITDFTGKPLDPEERQQRSRNKRIYPYRTVKSAVSRVFSLQRMERILTHDSH